MNNRARYYHVLGKSLKVLEANLSEIEREIKKFLFPSDCLVSKQITHSSLHHTVPASIPNSRKIRITNFVQKY